MSHVRTRPVPLLALAILCPAALAAEDKDPATRPDFAQTVAKTTTETEEVIVSGRLDRLSDVQKAIVAAENRFYNRYNELNKNRDFDIVCMSEKPTGTQLSSRYCEAGYVTEAKRDAAVYGLLRYGSVNDKAALTSSIELTRLDELRKNMRDVVAGDPELQRALVERSLLVERMEKIRKQKFRGRMVVWD